MLIRPARIEDAPAIAKVHVESWRTTYAGIIPDDVLAGLRTDQREQMWRDFLSRGHPTAFLLVAENDDGEVVGFANAGPERENDPLYKAELYAIYLLHSSQKQGIGRALFDVVIENLQALNFTSMLVCVLAENQARQFYERMGGQYLREKPITIGGMELVEVAYGWDSI